MRYNKIKDAMAFVFKDLKITTKHINKVEALIMDVVTRPGGNAEFFSGNLFGTVQISFTATDVKNVITNIFGVDMAKIGDALSRVDHSVRIDNAIKDELNITCAYVCHLIYNSDLSEEDKKRGVKLLHLLFALKTICWKVKERLHYTCSNEVARSALEACSYRFKIKQLGSWYKVLDNRANNLADDDGIHTEALKSFELDKGVSYYITDSIGSISSTVSCSYNEMDKASKSNEKVLSSSMSKTNLDGSTELTVRQLTSEKGRRAIDSIISDRRSFLKDDWIKITLSVNPSTTRKALVNIVTWISENRYGDLGDDIASIVDNSVIVVSQSLSKPSYKNSSKTMRSTLLLLKGFYGSSRSSSKNLHGLRASGSKIIKKSKVKITPSSEASTRCSLFIYMAIISLLGGE